MKSTHEHTAPVRFPILQGVLPITAAQIPAEILAGITLAAIAIPEVMGYTKISGTPVITGLYTMLIPTALFALFGSSRHLVVGADSATAAILAAGLVGIASIGSEQYLALAGVLALMTGVFLILARIMRLGFLADFLSRTVLIGFLTGVEHQSGERCSDARYPVAADSRVTAIHGFTRGFDGGGATAPGQGMSAVELIDGEPEPEVDLWQIRHNGDKTQKEAELMREVQRSRQLTKREQIREMVRKTANREMGMERCIER
jgi:hypothetical protein